jgi:hypothetical protein
MTLKREKPSKCYTCYGMCYCNYICKSSKKKSICKNLLDTYLKPKTHNEKMSKATYILENLVKTYFYNLKYENQCTLM